MGMACPGGRALAGSGGARARMARVEGLDYGALVRTICERGLHRERPSTLDQWALAQRLSGIGVQGESPELELFAVGQR